MYELGLCAFTSAVWFSSFCFAVIVVATSEQNRWMKAERLLFQNGLALEEEPGQELTESENENDNQNENEKENDNQTHSENEDTNQTHPEQPHSESKDVSENPNT